MIAGLFIFILRDYLTDGKYIYFHSDLQHQMMPMTEMFLGKLFKGFNIFYSFDIGLGMGTIPVYTNGTCFSFLNIILLLPLKSEIRYFLLFLIKVSLGAFAFSELNIYVTKKRKKYIVLFSLAYALCSFNLVYYYVIIWHDGIYMLPIIILAIYRFLNEKKTYLLMFSYAYLFICNFYSGYVIGIYSFIIFLCLLWMNESKIKDKFRKVINYIIHIFVSVLISSAFLLPTAVYLINNDASENTGFEKISINMLDLIEQLFMGQYVFDQDKGLTPYVYCGLFSLMCMFIFYFNKKIKNKAKIYFSIPIVWLFFCFLTKPGYMIMHAFNNPDSYGNRFAFLLSFTILFIVSLYFDDIIETKKKYVVSISLSLIIYFLLYNSLLRKLSSIEHSVNYIVAVLNVLIILIYTLMIVYNKKKKDLFVSGLIVLTFIEIIYNGIILNNTLDRSTAEYKDIYDVYCVETEKKVEQLGDDYTRIIVNDPISYNLSQNIGYRSLCIFSSFIDTDLRKTIRKLGYLASNLDIKDQGYTEATGLLLGVDDIIYIRKDNAGWSSNVEEKRGLPIAYMVNDDLFDVKLNDNPFDNINMILSAMCGEDKDYFYNTGNNIELYTDNVIIDDGEYEGRRVVAFSLEDLYNNHGNIRFIDPNKESRYCYFSINENYIYYDSPIVSGSDEGYRNKYDASFLSSPHIVSMNETDDCSECYIILDEQTVNGYYFDQAYFYGCHDEILDGVYEHLKSMSIDIDRFGDGRVSGYVESIKDNDILFTSIPYDDNWNAYIDGQKVETIRLIDNAFLGIVIPEGKHYIELKYVDKWMIRGLMLSLVGWFIIIIMFVWDRSKPEKKEYNV